MSSPTLETGAAARSGAPGKPAWQAPAIIAGGVLLVAAFIAATVSLTHGAETAVDLVSAALRFARYLGALVAVGGFVFLAFVHPAGLPITDRGRRLAVIAAVTGGVATVVAVPVQAASVTGRVAAATDVAALGTILRSGFGTSVVVGVVGLVLVALAASRLPSSAASAAGAAGSLLVLGAFLFTGHTTTSEPQAVTLTANLAHTAAGAVWLGGLALLPFAMRERKDADDAVGGARLVSRFSTAATFALLAVAAAGSALAWVEVRALAALTTPYGAILVAKVAVVAAVAALGAYNNRRLVPAIRRGDDASWERLTRIVRLEAIGLVVVVGITAVLVNVIPARVEAGIDAQVVRIASLGADRTTTIIVEPARPGSNEVHLFVEGGRLDDPIDDLTLHFIPPGAETASTVTTPTRVSPGHWLHLGGELSSSGEWQVEITANIAGTAESVRVTIPVTGVDEWDGIDAP